MLRIALGVKDWEDSFTYVLHASSPETAAKGEYTIVDIDGFVPSEPDNVNIEAILNGFNAQSEGCAYYHFTGATISDEDAAQEVILVNARNEATKALKALRTTFL